MKTRIFLMTLLAALAAAFAFAIPADAASKKKKKTYHRAPVAMQHKVSKNDVYVGNELVGRDPDPSIRAFMRRNPQIWDGPE